MPKTNSIIEHTSQDILAGTTECLLEAGLPPCYWSFAAPCFCVNYNRNRHAEDGYPWSLSQKAEFDCEIFSFGCLVSLIQSHARSEAGRSEPKGELGAFADYRLQHGYKWNSEYLVWELTRFRQGDLRVSAVPDLQDMGVRAPPRSANWRTTD
jgi:hypothetical protein